MGRRLAFVGLACAAIAAAAGCPANHSGPVRYAAAREYAAGEYENVLARWTRRADIYREFQSQAFVSATFKTPDFRRAFVSAYAGIMDIGGAEAQRLWAAELAGAQAWHEFTVMMYTTDRKWNDLDTAASVWRVRLLSGSTGVEVPPAEVISVKELSPQMRTLHPHATPFTRFYFVRFPKKAADGREVLPEAGGEINLEFVSGLGKAICAWEIAP